MMNDFKREKRRIRLRIFARAVYAAAYLEDEGYDAKADWDDVLGRGPYQDEHAKILLRRLFYEGDVGLAEDVLRIAKDIRNGAGLLEANIHDAWGEAITDLQDKLYREWIGKGIGEEYTKAEQQALNRKLRGKEIAPSLTSIKRVYERITGASTNFRQLRTVLDWAGLRYTSKGGLIPAEQKP